KLAKNANRVNKNLVLPDEYIALEFKGMSGAGAIEVDKNLTFRIRGLNNIHVLDCFVNVALEPADGVVDFGKINSRTIKNTSVSETFSVVMTKDPGAACTEQFNILGSFFTTDILSDYSHLDMGNGLLLKIFHKDGTATEFNRFSQFASFSSSSAPSVTAPFRAELSANPAETVVEGPFSKDVILKITYN
ncbi:TPA: fimbrial protein, partial [Escherichia coli]|nr:fimbrial protein [Escherichia coli]